MPLTCECDWGGDYDWYFEAPEDYSALATSRRKRCASCKRLIDIGACCTEFLRTREARSGVEMRIYGEGDTEAIALASYYLCEECSDLYFSLSELGFECISPNEPMKELVKEYVEVWGKGK